MGLTEPAGRVLCVSRHGRREGTGLLPAPQSCACRAGSHGGGEAGDRLEEGGGAESAHAVEHRALRPGRSQGRGDRVRMRAGPSG